MRGLIDLIGWNDLTPQEQAFVVAAADRGAVGGFVCWLVSWAVFRGRRGGGLRRPGGGRRSDGGVWDVATLGRQRLNVQTLRWAGARHRSSALGGAVDEGLASLGGGDQITPM
jgi:hypothetical protein